VQHDITRFLPRMFTELAEGNTETIDAVIAKYDDTTRSERTLVQSADLTDDERALAIAALNIAAAMEDLDEGVSNTLFQLRGDLTAGLDVLGVAQAFDKRLSEAVTHLPNPQAVASSILTDYTLMRSGEPSREALRDFISEHFEGVDQRDLLSLVSAMSDADIERTWDIAASDVQPYQTMIAKTLGTAIYQCQESYPFNSMEGYDRVTAELAARYPLFGISQFRGQIESTLAPCVLFEPHPRDGFHDPVVSDIPTLVLNGTLDIQTSMDWGADAAATLSNSRNYIIPEAGHGTIIYQQCSKDIATAFVNDPSAELDVSCIDDIQPTFVLPDDPLP
jgi:pimeloyl-ACP methyl ester carboxylesterase